MGNGTKGKVETAENMREACVLDAQLLVQNIVMTDTVIS